MKTFWFVFVILPVIAGVYLLSNACACGDESVENWSDKKLESYFDSYDKNSDSFVKYGELEYFRDNNICLDKDLDNKISKSEFVLNIKSCVGMAR